MEQKTVNIQDGGKVIYVFKRIMIMTGENFAFRLHLIRRRRDAFRSGWLCSIK